MEQEQENGVPTEGQRRYVSLLFADLCGYTALNEAADPEDAESIKREIVALATEVILKRGGAISQIYGDGILAVFGLPAAREDDARRAIEAALELHEATRNATFDVALPAGFEVRLHTGVHAGLVFSRHGDEIHGRYQLSGDAVNTTQRLCSVAGRDEVLVSRAALRGFEEFFATEPAASIALRGKRVPVAAHTVTGRSGLRTSFEARSRRGLTTFSGRERELAQIATTMQDAHQGSCRVVLITGDAGIGKSRLLEQLRRNEIAGTQRTLRGSCDSYGETGPLEPFLQILRQVLELPAGTDADEGKSLLESQLALWGPRMQEHGEWLLRLLFLLRWPAADAEFRSLMQACSRALCDLIAALSVRVPIVMLLDDWQWADDASSQVLAQMCEDLKACRVCIVIAMREGGEQRALPKASLTLRLLPFTMEESQVVVRGLRSADFDTGLTWTLHVRSGGNPLFLEELCRSLPDGPLEGTRAFEHGDVPNTLQGVIQARVAAFPAPQLELLRAASVIGIEFSRSLLDSVLPRSTDTDARVEALIQQAVIYRTDHDDSFRFKHGLTRDVIYESVRLGERKRIHAQVATAIEASAAAHGDHAEALAFHHRQAGNHEKAAQQAELAGDKAMAAASLDRACFHYAAALSALDRLLPEKAIKQRWLEISRKWASPSSYNPAHDQLEILARAADYARELADTGAEAQANYYLGWFHYVFGDYQPSLQAYERGLELAQASADHKLEAQLCSTLGQAHAASGAYDEAMPLLERGIEYKRARQHPRYRAWNLAHALGCKGLVHADRGEFDQSARDFGEAFAVVGGTGHPMEASLLALLAMNHMRQGQWQACTEIATRGREAAARTNSSYVYAVSEVFEAYGHFMLDGSHETLAQMQRAIDWLEARNHGLYLSVLYGCAAEVHTAAGDYDFGRAFAERGLARAQGGDPLGEAASYRALARIHAQGGIWTRADLDACLAQARRSGERRKSPREAALTDLLALELQLETLGPRARRECARTLAELERMQMPWYAQRARRLLSLH